MDGVSFNGIAVSNWGLYLSSCSIEKPTPKTSYIDIPFGDGSADLSEASGEVKFGMRKVSMILQGVMTTSELESLSSVIAGLLHGQKVKIKFDKDPSYYYYGRVSVSYLKAKAIGEIVIEAVCEPYKYKNLLTEQVEVVTTSKVVILHNDRKTAYPKITATASFSIAKDGITYSYGVVSDLQTTIPLFEGSNELTITGTGTITFGWQEGAL